MFGIDKIWDVLSRHTVKLGQLEGKSRYLESTNDKRYNEIDKRITKVRDYLGEEDISFHNKLADEISHRVIKDNLVTCDTCKCLLYKEDAIKGESRIKKTLIGFMVNWDGKTDREDFKEEIEEVWYCHKCDPNHINQRRKSGAKKKSSRTSKEDS